MWTCNKRSFTRKKVKIRRVKYLNNITKQNHRSIKRRIAISIGFKEFEAAQSTLAGIEVINMIKKDQILKPKSLTFKTFCALAS